MAEKGRRRRGGEQFYGEALSPADRRALLRALREQGCEGEVALLRLGIRRMLEQEEADVEALARVVNTLVRALRVQQQMGDRIADGLADALAQVIEELYPEGGSGDQG